MNTIGKIDIILVKPAVDNRGAEKNSDDLAALWIDLPSAILLDTVPWISPSTSKYLENNRIVRRIHAALLILAESNWNSLSSCLLCV